MKDKRRGLGKGIGALIADQKAVDEILNEKTQGNVENISIDKIKANENQPRKSFKPEQLEELAESIKEMGIIQPIIVTKDREYYTIVAGERRFRAAKLAGLNTVPAIVKELTQAESDKISIIENVQRVDLNPIEEALSFKSVMERYELTQEELSKAIGKSRSYISNQIRLLRLDPRVVDMLAEGKLSQSHGIALLKIDNLDEQYKRAKKIVDGKESVHKTRKTVRKVITREYFDLRDPYIIDLEEQMMSQIGTKVEIKDKKQSGTITIEYYNYDDLQRIYDLMFK
ncbi:MAG: ParB/RepB/Spo0J family partition protein [Tissierellia bacterium]|nr:ParB/RepB/Spo0J family partition protein [Tissierellia bacterium]